MGLTRIRAEQISDIDYKQAVRVITLSDVTLGGGAPATVDGVNLVAGNRVLVAGQSTGSQNGLYVVQTVGAGSNGTWIRSSDANADGEIEAGMIVMVTEGDIYKDTQWKLTTNDPIIVGTTALVFEQNSAYAFGNIYANGTAVLANAVGGTVTLTAGDNIEITGNNTSKTVTIGVTGISLNSISNGTSNVNIATANGNVTVGVSGNEIVKVSSGGIDVTGNILPTANITYDLGSNTQRWNDLYLANSTIYLGNAQISANSTSLIITNPAGGTTVLSGATPSVNANTVVATGNVTGGNLITAGVLSVTGNANVGNLGTAGLVTATGNITGGNLITAGLISATGNITGSNILGNGVGLSGINAFSSIAVTGSNTLTANSIATGLTFTGDPSIVVTANTSTNTVSFAFGGTGESIFATGGDMGLVTETPTATEDLGLVTDAVVESYDLGTIVTSGVIVADALIVPTYTVTTLPPTDPQAQIIFVSNESGGAVLAFSDGSNWRRCTDRAVVT